MISFKPFATVTEESGLRLVIRYQFGITDILLGLTAFAPVAAILYYSKTDFLTLWWLPFTFCFAYIPLNYVFDGTTGQITIKRAFVRFLRSPLPLNGVDHIEIRRAWWGSRKAYLVYESGRREMTFRAVWGFRNLQFCVDSANRFIDQLNGKSELTVQPISPYPRVWNKRSSRV